MGEVILKQYELSRERFIKRVQDLNPEIVDIQPKGFNNNIHWIVGHVLLISERFLFGFPGNSSNLPANYNEFFGSGTKPADWTGDVPSISVLIEQLKEQTKRISEIPASQFAQKLENPFLGCETLGELAGFGVFHEAMHLGQIQSLARIIQA